MFELFKSKAEAASAEVFRFHTTTEAVDFLAAFLKREGVADAPNATALCAGEPWLTPEYRAQLEAMPGVQFEVSRDRAAEAKFGVSLMEWALADTGTLAQDATPVERRLVSSLVSIFIALVPTAGLLPDLPDLLKRIDPKRIGYLAMVTGPSRTADIERVLTIGVHGPKRIPPVILLSLGMATVTESLGFEPRLQEVFDWLNDDSLSGFTRSFMMFAAVAIAPAVEETLFRGILLPALMKGRTFASAALLSGLYFALVHFHAPSLLPLLALSVAFSAAYAATGSLLTPIVMHALFNASSLLLNLAGKGN